MSITVAILGTGDMGSAVGKCLIGEGNKAVTCLEGRSERSRTLAINSGIEDCGSMQSMLENTDVLLSILPPAEAIGFAEQVCPIIETSENDILFVDCNAVSPATLERIASIARSHGVRFQDAGIIGATPRPGRAPVRFYTSGKYLEEMNELAAELIEIKPLGAETGRASAIKMVYASLTKGTHALRAAAAMAGETLGVGDEIRQEWANSLPEVSKAMESRIPILASDSERWTGEMREIAETYSSAGITPFFHQGAEWIYELLATTALADESRDEAGQKNRSVEETLKHFLDALNKA